MIRSFVRPVILFVMAATFTVMSTIPVGAIQDPSDCNANRYRTRNNITMYDPCDNGEQPICGPGSGQLRGSENLEKIFNYFKDKGLNDWLVGGIIGNIDAESGGDPTLVQISYQQTFGDTHTDDPMKLGTGVGVGRAWGLIQWDAGGRAVEYAKQAGITAPISELATQLDLVWWHMNNTSPTSRQNMMKDYTFTPANSSETEQDKTLRQAVAYYHDTMEGSAGRNIANRFAKAKNLIRQYGGNSVVGATPNPSSVAAISTTTPTAPTTNSTNCVGSVTGNAVATAINYAWPEYHEPPYTKMKDTYAAAVKKAQADGRYVGGGQYPGVDCGGFVTLVMQDSGVDTEYGGGGNTISQEKHMRESGKYTEIHPTSTADMQPGDIAIHDTHTYMYVGKIEGFETEIASASISFSGQGWRAPMAGNEMPADTSYRWYRLTASSPASNPSNL